MKDFLNKLIEAKQAKIAELKAKSEKSESLDEVRSIGVELEAVTEEIRQAKEELAKAEQKSFNPVGTYGIGKAEKKENEDVLSSMEYRQAFVKYVRTGKWEARADEFNGVEGLGKIIPNTILNEFIKELKSRGQIYSRVRKTSYKGGIEIPIEELVPQVRWVATEGTRSDDQKAPEYKASIIFSYHLGEVRVATSLLADTVTLDVLEREIAVLIAEAYVAEMDKQVVHGSGVGQPMGIVTEAFKAGSRIKASHKITMTEEDVADWKTWRTKLFAKIPLRYRGQGILLMSAGTWEANIMTLADDNNNPVYSETYNPQTGELVCRFNGREVVLVEDDILASFADIDTATATDAQKVFAIYLKPTDYLLNSNMQFTYKRYFDEDTNKWIDKALFIVDGKMVDTNSVFVISRA
jgi:HK97 family phage major capsid protein